MKLVLHENLTNLTVMMGEDEQFKVCIKITDNEVKQHNKVMREH